MMITGICATLSPVTGTELVKEVSVGSRMPHLIYRITRAPTFIFVMMYFEREAMKCHIALAQTVVLHWCCPRTQHAASGANSACKLAYLGLPVTSGAFGAGPLPFRCDRLDGNRGKVAKSAARVTLRF